MNIVGFDLGSSSLKIIEGSPSGKRIAVEKAYEFEHPFGSMLPPDQEQFAQLADMMKKVIAEKKISTQNVHAALPESLISTKIISTPTLTDAELASAIDWLAEQHIAIPLEELKVEYQVLYRPEGNKKNENMRVALFGVPISIINSYMHLFELMDIQPTILETQVISIMRTFVTEQMPTTLLVHMGASTTDLCIIHEGELVFVYSFGNGGRLLTRSIERGLNIDTKQAEEYKRTYGVDPQYLEGKLIGILSPVLQLFVTEIQKALQFFMGQFGTQQVKRVLLSGGGAHMPGLATHLASVLSLEVTVARPFADVNAGVNVQLPTDREASFVVATGLLRASS